MASHLLHTLPARWLATPIPHLAEATCRLQMLLACSSFVHSKHLCIANSKCSYACKMLSLHANMLFVNLQIEVHPRYPQTELRSFCQQNNIAVVAYSSLGVGDLLHHPTVMQIATDCNCTSAQVICVAGMARHGCYYMILVSEAARLSAGFAAVGIAARLRCDSKIA